jgi:hypothetical protein
MYYRSLCSVALLAALMRVPAALLPLEAIQFCFHPYSTGPLRSQGLTSGMTIDQQHSQVAAQLLPAEVLCLVQQRDFTIAIQGTTDLPARETYITATTEQFSNMSLDSSYRIENY